MANSEVTIAEAAEQLRRLGVRAGSVLLVHTSYRALRPIVGGPRGLLDALREALGPEGTLVLPSWTDDEDGIFDPARTPCAADLGVLSETFRALPGVLRSAHPFACAAAGPRARAIVEGPLPLPPHHPDSPVGRVHDEDGQVLLLGVGHDANTTVHVAELLGGAPYRVPRHITVLEGAGPRRIEYGENDHCCQGFALLDGWLRERGLQREGLVGHGVARLMNSRDVVAVARAQLQRDPLVFLHGPEAGCEECDEARASVLSCGTG